MGEHKVRAAIARAIAEGRASPEQVREAAAQAIAEGMTDSGKLLEQGFEALVREFHADGVADDQRRQLRQAFFLGADHLFFGVMAVMSEGPKITERDMLRMQSVSDELEQFRREALGESQPAPGRTQ